MTTPVPPPYQPPSGQHQTWQQLPPSMQIPAQRQAPPTAVGVPAASKPRTGLKVALGAVAGLLVGLVIGSAGGTQPSAAGTSTAAGSGSGSAKSTYQAAPAPVAPALPAGPLTTFSDGTYEIGPDIVPGKYKTPGPGTGGILNSCYMEVGNGSGRVDGITQNDNLTGPGVVTLPSGKVFKANGGCVWTKVG